MITVLARIVADAVVIAAVLFAAAGTLVWPRAWVLLAVLLVIRVASAAAVFRVNPSLLRERATVLMHREQPWWDRLILLAFMGTSFIFVPAVAALDAFRWEAASRPPLALATIGLVLFALGWVMIGLALRANAFAVTVVRLQGERQHAVADQGVYGKIRHPMYAGSPLVNVGLSLWLESYSAALLSLVPLILLLVRIHLEERVLRRELPGYADYMDRVPYRMIPRVW
jgi:protein-S-isoprenylcysteine O-methyltransferase Ste14